MHTPTRHNGPAFSLAELMIAVAVIGLLAALLMPALAAAMEAANRTACASNLHQIGLAMQLYLKDHDGWFFPLREPVDGGTLWYFGYESSGSVATGEGNRTLDRTRAKLYPYLGDYETVEICPAFPYTGPYKAKYRTKWWTYGVNRHLADHFQGHNIGEVRNQDASRTVLFADAAQVNTWQAPASRQNPLVEEWFYIERRGRMVQFRHGGLANALMADWHVEALPPAERSLHPYLTGQQIGYFDDDRVLYKPLGG